MAAPPPGPDTLITIKVAFDGGARKLKFPLRDLTADLLEPKLRLALGIPAETNAIIERYSDSSAAYITLDAANASVYKQLFRAAKAKQKLKLRVSRVMPETPALPPTPEAPQAQVTTTEPKPASVEAESTETENESNSPSPQFQETTEAIQSTETNAKPVAKTFEDLQAQRCDIITRVNKAMDRIEDLQARLPFARAASEASMPISAISSSGTQDSTSTSTSTRSGYAVCCNSCDVNIPYEHYHCSICDDGDFDLCPSCYNQGVICHHPGHVLAKRFIDNGSITAVAPAHMSDAKKLVQAKAAEERLGQAHAEYLAKLQVAEAQKAALRRTNEILAQAKAESSRGTIPVSSPVPSYESVVPSIESCDSYSQVTRRTCNSCIQDLPEAEFVHCQTCDDFDLCKVCFAKNRHGHHPKHAFAPIVPGTCTELQVKSRLAPGRNQLHHAICDGCEKDIRGVRHKCLQCPDWDYCSTCHESAKFIHAGHRFVPIYEPLEPTNICPIPRALTHVGVCCDGPHCNNNNNSPGYNYIVGDRYKCAVCDDVDFCAKCEASPTNAHNKTHPLIKFKTPVRNVNVITTGEHENGRKMPAMGDRPRPCRRGYTSRDRVVQSSNVMTVVDVKPSEPASSVKTEVTETPAPPVYVATYVRDKVVDGTVFGPDHVFEQTWVVRNDGPTAWPAGCFVKYLHGEYMGHVDSNHPTATGDLESCLQSNVCQHPVAPGDTVPFTVLLRSPSREGRHISHWRVSTKDGLMIGHKLWCDIVVKKPEVAPEEKKKEVPVPVKVEDVEKDMSKLNIAPDTAPIDHSQVVFPKLDKESPSASIHQGDAQSQAESRPEEEDYEECEDVEWDEDASESYMTDEEYDILDASDEESVAAPRK